MRVPSLGWEDPLEEGMVTHSSTLAWRMSWTEEPGKLVHGVIESDTTEVTQNSMEQKLGASRAREGRAFSSEQHILNIK